MYAVRKFPGASRFDNERAMSARTRLDSTRETWCSRDEEKCLESVRTRVVLVDFGLERRGEIRSFTRFHVARFNINEHRVSWASFANKSVRLKEYELMSKRALLSATYSAFAYVTVKP